MYHVRYLTDDEGVAALSLGEVPPKFVLEIAAGMLFLSDFCPGNAWCIYVGTSRLPVLTDSMGHPIYALGYGDSNDLWPEV